MTITRSNQPKRRATAAQPAAVSIETFISAPNLPARADSGPDASSQCTGPLASVADLPPPPATPLSASPPQATPILASQMPDSQPDLPASANQASAAAPTQDQAALAIVRRHLPWAAGCGMIPLPGLDFAAVAGVQLRLVQQLSTHYGVPFKETAARAIIAALMAVIIESSLRTGLLLLFRWVPLVGQGIGLLALPAVAVAATFAIGKVFILHYESGGTLLDFNVQIMRQHFRQEYAMALKT